MTGAPADLASLSPDERRVALAMALAWGYRTRKAILALLKQLDWRRRDGREFALDDVRLAIEALEARGLAAPKPQQDGYHRLANEARGALYKDVLETAPADVLLHALYAADVGFRDSTRSAYWQVTDPEIASGLLRMALYGPVQDKALEGRVFATSSALDYRDILFRAVLPGFDAGLFARVPEGHRWTIAADAAYQLNEYWLDDMRPLTDWAGRLIGSAEAMPENLRYMQAESALFRGDTTAAVQWLEGLDGGPADALRAGAMVVSGRWAEGQAAFEAAIKLRQSEVRARKRALPARLVWLYVVALLAQQTPAAVERARKFAVSESGQRDPAPYTLWGEWTLAARVRLGDTDLPAGAFDFDRRRYGPPSWHELWMLLAAAWLGPDLVRPAAGSKTPLEVSAANEARWVGDRITACGFGWLASLAGSAAAVLSRQAPAAGFFVPGPGERWRDVLASLRALDAEAESQGGAQEATRLVWSVVLGADGEVLGIEPFEQKRGVRGWNRPVEVSLAKVGKSARLAPWDAPIARAIRQQGYSARNFVIDRAAAIVALVGHPAVVFGYDFAQTVELTADVPELEAVRKDGGLELRVLPELRRTAAVVGGAFDDLDGALSAEEQALRLITVVRDSPQRARVIRFTAAQRRAATLLAGQVTFPDEVGAEVQQVLSTLARHFRVHSDAPDGARTVAAEARLRAELAPVGDGVSLRLVAAPLGADGPRLEPGRGRARLMSTVSGETIGTQRDLAAERAGVERVLDALPFLEEDCASPAPCEWLVPDPERALAVVEALPALEAVAALDWPKGKPVRVVTVDTPQLAMTVRQDRDWFRVAGRIAVGEDKVLEMEALLAAVRRRSRFVPMGEGLYAALSRSLAQRLADLAVVTDADAGGSRVSPVGALWLQEILEGTRADTDAAFRRAVDTLQEAQRLAPPVPRTLRTELRPYQEDGFRWALRLAHAGLGGCLADDMGLGKTIQALAVLLARARGGPALVVAPTSVCGNWVAEAARFAPSLRVLDYGSGDREVQVAKAKAMDVIVVSYGLLLQDQARFAARRWHTLVADEAQAIKNPVAKRSVAMFQLEAGFRLAMSGTPVENRLSELWSILRFTTPGLLGTAPKFAERFVAPIERDRDRDAQHLLKRLISPFVLRRTKAQVLDELPPRTESVVTVVPDEAEAAHYEALRREAVDEVNRATADGTTAAQARFNILAQLTRLRRAACDPRLATPDFGSSGEKVRAFTRLAQDLVANGHKALVFSQFVDFLKVLREALDAQAIAYQYLDGATPAGERTRRVASFQSGDGDLFLISLKAGGFGLNLTAADYVVIADPWWNPAAEDQATGRAHRIGQHRPVTVYRLVTAGTIEERIVDLHHDKRALAEGILEGGDIAALPSSEELLALMRGREQA